MTPQAQNIAIAQACGWEEIRVDDNGRLSGLSPINIKQGFNDPDNHSWFVPNYTTDLNAMREAIMSQGKGVQCDINCYLLYKTFDASSNPMGWHKVANATAAQRAEAFLRTLNLWEEDES